MKQVILLEPHEVNHLQRGKGLEITTPGGTLMLRFETNGHNSIGAAEDRTCKKCGKVCKNARGLLKHTQVKHG